MDIVVSVNIHSPTCQKRGHKSHNGCVTMIEHQTGLIVDYVALINYCHECQTGSKQVDVVYDAWETQHAEQCQKNIDFKSGAMEVERTCFLFNSLVEHCGIRTCLGMGMPRHCHRESGSV